MSKPDISDVQVVYSLECHWCGTDFTVDEGQLGLDGNEPDFVRDDLLQKHFMERHGFREAYDNIQIGNACGRCIRLDKLKVKEDDGK